MDEVGAMGVGELLRRIMRDFGEDDGGERGGLRAGGCGVLCQDCGVVSYASAAWLLAVALLRNKTGAPY